MDRGLAVFGACLLGALGLAYRATAGASTDGAPTATTTAVGSHASSLTSHPAPTASPTLGAGVFPFATPSSTPERVAAAALGARSSVRPSGERAPSPEGPATVTPGEPSEPSEPSSEPSPAAVTTPLPVSGSQGAPLSLPTEAPPPGPTPPTAVAAPRPAAPVAPPTESAGR